MSEPTRSNGQPPSRSLPLVSSDQVITALHRLGFVDVHTKGSHMSMRRVRGERTDFTVVVLGRKEIPRGTLRSILALAHVSPAEFLDALGRKRR